MLCICSILPQTRPTLRLLPPMVTITTTAAATSAAATCVCMQSMYMYI